MQDIIVKVLSDHLTLVTAADDKITNAMGRINIHHMPKNRLPADGDHRLGSYRAFLTDPRSESSRQNDRLHRFFMNIRCYAVAPSLRVPILDGANSLDSGLYPTTRAGTPTAMAFSGTSSTTTAPAPMTAPAPIRTP